MAKGYWIVRVDVKDEEPVKRYVAGNHPIFEKFGGRFLVRSQKFEVPEGSSRSLHVVIEFPDYASALRAITRLSIKPTRRLETGIWSPTSSLSRATMARSHGAKRHFNDFPGSSLGRESDGYLCVTLQFQAPVCGWFTRGSSRVSRLFVLSKVSK